MFSTLYVMGHVHFPLCFTLKNTTLFRNAKIDIPIEVFIDTKLISHSKTDFLHHIRLEILLALKHKIG